jgi:hypothetical protein
MGNSEPADRANTIASSSSVDNGALWKPIRRRAAGMDGGVKGRDVLGGARARNRNDKDTERIGAGEQLNSLESAEQPG